LAVDETAAPEQDTVALAGEIVLMTDQMIKQSSTVL